MKKIIVLLLSFSLTLFAGQADAQLKKAKVKGFINKTNIVLKGTYQQVKKNKVKTGKLGKAIEHQAHAKKLFNKNKLQKALYHSNRARELAIEAYRQNKGIVPVEWQLGHKELQYFKNRPSSENLDELVPEGESNEKAASKISDIK